MGSEDPQLPVTSSVDPRMFDVDLTLHGHAHKGTFSAQSSTGTRIFNVALHILHHRGEDHPFTIFNL